MSTCATKCFSMITRYWLDNVVAKREGPKADGTVCQKATGPKKQISDIARAILG